MLNAKQSTPTKGHVELEDKSIISAVYITYLKQVTAILELQNAIFLNGLHCEAYGQSIDFSNWTSKLLMLVLIAG